MDIDAAFIEGLTPDERLNLLEWADRYFYLPRESTAEHGKYRSERTPMIKEILEVLSPSDPTEVVVLMKPTQLAGTTAALIFMLGSVDVSPGPGLFIQPTGDLARAYSKKRFVPSLRATVTGSGRLEGKVRDQKARSGTDSTILEKVFLGGSWRMAGSNSPAVYRSESVRYLILDDLDGFEMSVGGEGSPVELADRRTGTFANRKIFFNSTPTIKGLSHIERAYLASSQGRWHVPCPFCDHFQELLFHNLKFSRTDDGQRVTGAWYECEACGDRIDEHHKGDMLSRGKYVHRFPDNPVRGFHYNALCTPLGWVNSWARIAQIFLDSKDNTEKRQAWQNTLMAEPFEARGDQPEWAGLLARSEPYPPMTVPSGALLLTAGVDVQDNRLAVLIVAWGEGEECWVVYWGELYGDPALPEVWVQLDALIHRGFDAPHLGGQLYITIAAVDSGGHHTQMVYDYCRRNSPRAVAVKGSSYRNKPIIGMPSKAKQVPGVSHPWPVGTDTAKALLYNRFRIKDPGPGCCHFYIGLDEDFFRQVTAEKLITRYSKGFPVQEWVKVGPRNEALDCFVYAIAAAFLAGIKRIDWSQLKGQAQPQVPPSQGRRQGGGFIQPRNYGSNWVLRR